MYFSVFFTILIAILLQTSTTSVVMPWTKYVIDDAIPECTIITDNHRITTGEDLIVQCHVIRLCLTAYVAQCTDPGTVKWFLPNTLPPRDNTERKQIEFKFKIVGKQKVANVTEDVTSINITSILKLNQIGFIHVGHYECTSYYEQQAFNLKVTENPAHTCKYHDQCTSYNCYNGHCQCSGPEQNYVLETNNCVKRASLSQSCASDPECALSHNLDIDPKFKQHLSPIKCAQNQTSGGKTCQCGPSDVQVNLAIASTDVCLPKATLGSICYSTSQCEASTGLGSFCGLDMRGSASNITSSAYLLVCQCKDGWRPSSGNKTCTPYSRCDSSKLGFNELYLRGSCPSNQFCRNNYCLCDPNYEFTENGGCILQRGVDTSKSFLEIYFWEIIACIVVVTSVVFLLAMIHLIKSKLTIRRNKAQMKQMVYLSEVRQRGNLDKD